MQGVGNLLASLTMFILLSSSLDIDWVWRLALGAGAVPGLLTVYFRYKMEESSHYKKHAASRASSMVPSVAATPRLGGMRRGSAQVGVGGFSISPLASPASGAGGVSSTAIVPGSARTVHLTGTALDFSPAGKSGAIAIAGSSSSTSNAIAMAPVGGMAGSYPSSSSSASSSFMMPPPSPSSSSSLNNNKKSVSINSQAITMTPETSRQARAARAAKAKEGASSNNNNNGPSKSPSSLKNSGMARETTSNSYSSSSQGSYISGGLDLHVADGDASSSSLLANEHGSSPGKDSSSTAGGGTGGFPISSAALVPFQEGAKGLGRSSSAGSGGDVANEATPLVDALRRSANGPSHVAEPHGAPFYNSGGSGGDGGDEGENSKLIQGEGGQIVGIDVGETFTGAEHESLGFCGRMMAPFRQLGATIWEFRWLLLGTAGSWFIFDIVFYANGEFSGSVLQDMGWSKAVNKSDIGLPSPHSSSQRMLSMLPFFPRFLSDATPASEVAAQQHALGTEQGMQAAKEALAATALGNLILALIGLPGYVVAVMIIDKLGRRNLQLLGFGAVAFIYTVLGVALAPLVNDAKPALLIFYGLSFFFLNVGPNTSTFVIPAEAFPTRAKATCHGISAASGKLGAVIGAAMMSPLLDWYGSATPEASQKGLALVLYACAAVSVIGFIWTFFFTQETSKISIEHLDRYGVHSFRMQNKTKSKTGASLRNRKSGGNGGGDYDEVGLATLDESGSESGTTCSSATGSGATTPRGGSLAEPTGVVEDNDEDGNSGSSQQHKQQKRLGLAGSSAAMDIKPSGFGGASMSNSSHSSRLLVVGNGSSAINGGGGGDFPAGSASYSEGLMGASPASGTYDLGSTPPPSGGPQLPHVPGMLVSDEERAKILGRPWSPGMELKTPNKTTAAALQPST